jgi:ribosome recycling factor
MLEESHVAVRNIRRDSLERLRTMEKNKELSKDESRKAQDQLQKLTDAYIARLNKLGGEKEAEILEV